MPTFRVTGGALTLDSVGGNYPSNELPGVEGPVDPGYGISSDRPSNPIVLPPDPPGVWPGPRPSHPIVIAPPGTPPGVIWPTRGVPSIQAMGGQRAGILAVGRCRAIRHGRITRSPPAQRTPSTR